ncbi:Tom40 [Spironucleus salmonicida]|uniref:Tom40 n=1 Tax=Spironucleus salmonicida TaxID=348837 RepID=K7R1H3_9EUKA|nr:Tom40 [Spironucleus salmonicida]KAH0570101.1 Tom40 [Spironucleus salmonicida]|eukprot:EST42628.1 Tom40 [Spironucleus salmonicida]
MSANPGEYANIFSDVNSVLNDRGYSQMQFTKTFSTPKTSFSATLTPSQISLAAQAAPRSYFSGSANLDTAANAQMALNLGSAAFKTNSTAEFTPIFDQTIQDAIQGKQGKYVKHDVNFREQLHVLTENANSSLLYNMRGRIFAGSSLVKLGAFSAGFEAVHVASRSITLQAAALKYQKDGIQVVGQVNSTKTAALGAVFQGERFAIAGKLQGSAGQVQGSAGVVFGVSGGQINVNIDSLGAVGTGLKVGLAGGLLEVGGKFKLGGAPEVGFSLVV